MGWIEDKIQGVKDWFGPVWEKLWQAWEFVNSLWNTSADPIQADTETRKVNEDFLTSKWIAFWWLLWDVTDFVKAIPWVSAVTQTPMEKVELYWQRFSPVYKTFKDNIETIQALVNQWKMDYNLWIETIKGEVDKLQNNSNIMSKEIWLTNQDLKINDIETLIDIWIKWKESKDNAMLDAGKKFEAISAKLFWWDPEKAAKTRSTFIDEWTAATEENVKKAVTDIAEWKRSYDWDALNWDYFLWNNIPKLRDYWAEQYSILGTQEDRAQNIIDEARAAGKDTTDAEAKKSAITKIKNDYKDSIIKFSNYYLDNIGTENSSDMQDFFDTYKEKTWTDMDELLGIKKNWLINNYETSAQLLVDQIDRDIRPTENKRLYDAGGPMQKIDVTVASAAWRLNKYIAEWLSEKIWETINKVTWWDYVSDPFSRSDNTRMKNFLFSFNKESEPWFIEKTWRTIQQIWPEVWMLLAEMRGFGKLKSASWKWINKALWLWLETLKWLWYFDEYEDLIRWTRWVELVASKLTWLWKLVWVDKTVAINDAIKSMPSNLLPITKDILAGTFSAIAEWPALSWLFDQFNPQGYQQWDAVLDMVFMWLDALVDSAKAFQYYSKPMSFQRMMQNPKFYDTYYQKLVGVSPQYFSEQTPQYKWFANLYAQRYLDTAVNSAKKMESINPKIIDRTIQTIKGTYSALAGKDMWTILKERGTKIFDFISGQTNETLSKKDLVKQQSKELLMPKIWIEEIAPWAKLWQVWYAMDKEWRKISSIHIDGSTPIFTGDKNSDTLLHKLFHTQNYKKYYWGKTMAELEDIWAKITNAEEKKKYMSALKRASVYLESEADTIKKLKDLWIDTGNVKFDVWSKADIEKANIDPELLAIWEINPDFDYLKISWNLEKDIIANVYMNTADRVIRWWKTIENTDFQKLISALENIDRNMFPGMVNRQKMYEELVKLNNAGKFSTKWNMADIQKLVDKATTMRVIFDSQLAMASDWKAAAFLKRNSSDYIITNFIFKILDSWDKKMFDLAMWDEYQELFYNMVKWDEALLKLAFWDDVKVINSGDLSAMVSSWLIDVKTARQIRDNRVRQFLSLPILNSTPYDNLVDAQSILAKALFIRLEKQFPNATDEVLQELARTVDTFFSTKNNDTFFKAIEKDKKISDAVKDTILKRIKWDEPKKTRTWLTKEEQEAKVTKNIRAWFIDKIKKSIWVDIIYDQKLFDDTLETIKESDKFKKRWTTVYWFVKDGKIYLNPIEATEATLFHEASHIWYYMAQKINPELFSKANDLIRQSRYYTDVSSTLDYIKTEKQRLDEAFARAIEDEFNNSWLSEWLVSQAKARLKQFYVTMLKIFGIDNAFLNANPELLKDLTLKDIQKLSLWDLVSWKSIVPSDVDVITTKEMFSVKTPDWKIIVDEYRDVRWTKEQLDNTFKSFAGEKWVHWDFYGSSIDGNIYVWTVYPLKKMEDLLQVAFSTWKPKNKQQINKEIKKLEWPLTAQNPLVITKKFPGWIETVPMKSVIWKSDEVIMTIASSENTLLDYLLNQWKITIEEYKTLIWNRYLDLWSNKNTLKQIEFLLEEKWYDSLIYSGKDKIFSEAEKIIEQTDKITLLEKELDNYDTQLKQYNDTKTALEQSRENVEAIKKSSFQIVGDLLPKLWKEYQTTLNTLRSKYRMWENVSLHSALKKITDDELLLKELVDDIAEWNLTWVYKLDISKKLTDFFYELAQRTGAFQDVFMGIRWNLNPEFLKKFADSTKWNIDFMRLVRITDKDFYEALRDSPAKFEEVFQQKAEDFEKVRYALQIAAWDDYISRAETWMNRYFWLAYKLPATYFSGVTMVVLNAIQNTTEMLFKHMEWTWTGDSVWLLRKKYGIISDENLLTSIWWGRQGNLNWILSTDKRSKLWNNLMTNWAYSIVEDMASGTFMNKATAQAMTEMWFQNAEEFTKYIDSVDQFKKDEMIAIINDRAVKIFEQRTANSVNPTRGKFVFGKLQTYAWPSETTKWVAAYDKLLNAIVIPVTTKSPEWVTSIPGRAWNILANTYMFMGTRWTRHIINSFKLIASPVATKKLYFQLIEERWLATANKLIREYYNKNFDSILLVNKIVSSIWIWARLDRLVDDWTDQDWFNLWDAREFWQMFYAPMQSIMSSPFGRAVFRFINWVFIDKNHQDMDVNWLNAWIMLLFKQVMNDLWRKFALPRAVVWAMNPASEENFFVWTRENLMGSTQWLMNMLSDDVIKQWFDFPVPTSNASRLAGIIPGLDKWKQKYFDESTLMKLKMIEEWDAYTFKNRLLYSIPFIKDRKSSAFSDKNYQEIVSKLGNDPVYMKAIMEGKLPINWDLDYVSNIFSVMTQWSLSQSNTLFERWKNFEQKFLWWASFLNAKEQATTAMLLNYLSKWESEAFIKAFNETDNTKTKQGLHLLAFIQSMEGWKMWSPWASSELIANIMQEQYYLWGNNFRKANPAYKYDTATKSYPPLPEDVDTAFKAQLVADYSDLLYTIDKNKFADALMYYIRKSNPEQASMFTELVPWEERKSVAFAKKSTEDVTYADWTFVPKWTVSWDYQANSVFKLDIFTKMQILNGDWDWYAMKNAFSTLYNPNSYQAKDPVYVSVALKSMNDNIAYINKSTMSEQDKIHMISGMMLWALPMINELQKNKKLQDSVWTIYNDTMYWLMSNVNDGIELATEIWYRKLQDGKFKKSPTKTWTVLDNYSATWNYYWNYFSSNYNKSNSILSWLKSFLQSNPGISTSKFDKPSPVADKSYIDSEKKLLQLTSWLYFVWTLDVWKSKFKREGIKLPSRSKSKWWGKWKWKWKWSSSRKPRKFFNTGSSK